MKKKTISIFIPHMGCPNDCIFCNQKKITGAKTILNYNDIKLYMDKSVETIGKDAIVEVAFFGGSFTALEQSVQNDCLKLANEFRDKIPNKTLIKVSTRPDSIDEKILSNLKKFKVDTIELGVQSMCDEVLIYSHRGHNSECVYSSSKLIRDYDIKLGIQLMVGLPKDDIKKFKYTIQEVIRIKPDIARIYPVLVIKDTHLETLYLNNEYSPLQLEQAIELAKYAYMRLEEEDIRVIRIGLQNTDNIRLHSDVIAGPFHPAFGELVKSRVYRDVIEKYLEKNINFNKELNIQTTKNKISQIIGNKKCNKKYFEEKYKLSFFVQENENLKENCIFINNIKFDVVCR